MTIVMGLTIVSFGVGASATCCAASPRPTSQPSAAPRSPRRTTATSSSACCSRPSGGSKQPFTTEQARAIGLDREVLQRMISQAAVDEQTRSARPRRVRRCAPRAHHHQSRFSGQVGRLRSAEVRLRPARQRPQRAQIRLRPQEDALRQFIVSALTTGAQAPKADGRGRRRRSRPDPVGRRVPVAGVGSPATSPPRRTTRSGPISTTARRATARPNTAPSTSSRSPAALANPAEVSDADAEAAYDRRRQGSEPRRAGEARSRADPLPEPGRGRRGGREDQGGRELRRHRQGARSEARGRRARSDGEGRASSTPRRARRCSPCRQAGSAAC